MNAVWIADYRDQPGAGKRSAVEIAQMLKDFRDLAMKYNIAIITGGQVRVGTPMPSPMSLYKASSEPTIKVTVLKNREQQ